MEKLIKQCKDGDRKALTRMYRLYAEKIYKFIYYRICHKETVEDLTSRTFINVLEKISQFNPERGAFSTWIFRIARNQVIDYFRTRKQVCDIQGVWDLAGNEDIEKDIMEQEQVRNLRTLLKKLKPLQREVIILRVWHDLSYKEIAGITGKSEAGCKMIFSRALARLRKDVSLAGLVAILFQRFI